MRHELALLLILSALNTVEGVAQPQDDWWDAGCKFRRKLALASQGEEALRAGYQVGVEIDASYLGMTDKCAKEFADVSLTHDGKRVPAIVRPGRKSGVFELWFRLQKDLAPRAKDAGYAVYYGNASPPANPATPSDIFDFYEDFSGPSERLRVTIDSDIKASLSGGRLVITDVAAERTERAPARIALKDFPATAGFSLSAELELESPEGTSFVLALVADMKEDVQEDAAALRRIGELADKLGDPDWETRESATRELIKGGRLALRRLEEAVRSTDAEVKWRAEHAIAQIRAAHPPATIVAAVRTGEGTRHATRATRIGKTRGDYPGAIALPGRLTITLNRDPGGDVEILWNGVRPDKGVMKGDLKEISFQLYKGLSGPIGRIALDTITIRRYVDEDSRPTHALEIEETKK